MDDSKKAELLTQFETYLHQTVDDIEDTNTTDLFALFTELAALRNEVKLESRQVKKALDMFKQNNQDRELMRHVLLDFLDVYDRLDAGMLSLNNYKPSFWKLFYKREFALIASIKEGQAMTLRRFEQQLAKHKVLPIDVLNKILDPHLMRAVEVDKQVKIDNGIVTGELRKGFMWENEILRLAEVKVNKI
ncbi:nucleotide exchange factor GrpE [Candidatus Marithrix sp. Canyon 246]|uniref:nucleotide exchange factor GrpE n=1 Tax=Candidatus Marithrix sp. Canyon 246 TaxID=1827136 RepID=UPI00084A19F7|nr:nucleotide exchange factor GrpE [Candidatus Marithrix sp. Canyon 246]